MRRRGRYAEVEELFTTVIATDEAAKARSSGTPLSGISERPKVDTKLLILRLEVFAARRFPSTYLGMRCALLPSKAGLGGSSEGVG
jgi:hypothetical protein